MRGFSIALLCLFIGCESNPDPLQSASPGISVVVERLVNLTPPEPNMPTVSLRRFDQKFNRQLVRVNPNPDNTGGCGKNYQVQIMPQLLFGLDGQDGQTRPTSEWSANVSINDIFTGTTSRVELSRLTKTDGAHRSLDAHLNATLTEFLNDLESAIKVLRKPDADLRTVLAEGSTGEIRVLLERLSMCPVPTLNQDLVDALGRSEDQTIRFRLVGLIGERRIRSAGDTLIDLIDLNDVEWTRAIIRTLSTLSHPRTQELLRILSVHDSPILQKEIKGASDRLEREQKIP